MKKKRTFPENIFRNVRFLLFNRGYRYGSRGFPIHDVLLFWIFRHKIQCVKRPAQIHGYG